MQITLIALKVNTINRDNNVGAKERVTLQSNKNSFTILKTEKNVADVDVVVVVVVVVIDLRNL